MMSQVCLHILLFLSGCSSILLFWTIAKKIYTIHPINHKPTYFTSLYSLVNLILAGRNRTDIIYYKMYSNICYKIMLNRKIITNAFIILSPSDLKGVFMYIFLTIPGFWTKCNFFYSFLRAFTFPFISINGDTEKSMKTLHSSIKVEKRKR